VQWRWDHGGNLGAVLVGRLGTRELNLKVDVAIVSTRLLHGFADAVGVYSQDHGEDPIVLLRVSDRAGREYPVAVSNEGHLLVGRDPLPGDAVISQWSGERLEVGQAGPYPSVNSTAGPDGFFFTACNDGSGFCSLILRTSALEPLRAPIAGRLSCLPSGLLEIQGDIRVRLEPFEATLGEPIAPRCVPPETPDVSPGTAIAGPGDFYITAFAADGSRLSVAAARDGTVYIGDFHPTIGCPCWRGIDQQ
jgi:hypothetical protein